MNRRKRFTGILFVGIIVLYFMYRFDLLRNFNLAPHGIYNALNELERLSHGLNLKATDNLDSEKLILFYTEYYQTKDWASEFSDDCPYKCRGSYDISDFRRSDAVLFGLLEAVRSREEIPRRDSSNWDQIWAFIVMESPDVYTTKSLDMTKMDNTFNWSISYRRDSDYFLWSGIFQPLFPNESAKQPFIETNTSSFLNRRHAVALISRCNAESAREAYIYELQKYITVDVYGDCGTLKCDKFANCYQLLGPKYKFWLAFENSICQDYVTEKFFHPFTADIIPVVYGYGPYSVHAPKGSYIDVRDYPNPEALANHLLYLDQNPSEYLKYFSWKKHFKVIMHTEKNFWCKFCEKLHTTDFKKNRKTYKSVGEWYRRNNSNQSLCLNATQFLSTFYKV